MDIPLVVKLFENLLHALLMALFGRAYKIIVRNIHKKLPQLLDLRHHPIHAYSFKRHALFPPQLFDFLAVFVRSPSGTMTSYPV